MFVRILHELHTFQNYKTCTILIKKSSSNVVNSTTRAISENKMYSNFSFYFDKATQEIRVPSIFLIFSYTAFSYANVVYFTQLEIH